MTERLRQLVEYDIWANREMLAGLPQQGTPPRSLKWMGHIIGAEHLWLARMAGRPAPLPVWPDLSLGECARALTEVSTLLSETLASASPSRLAETISYTNSKGEAWTSTVEDIVIHLTIHSAYHRGQMASDLRSTGHEPPYTDYIHAVRQGLVE
jgi:uncharacterized damage-inducible protein DinB